MLLHSNQGHPAKFSTDLTNKNCSGYFDYNIKTLKIPVVNLQRIAYTVGGHGQRSHTVIIFHDMQYFSRLTTKFEKNNFMYLVFF